MMISTIISLVTSVEFDIVGIIFLRYFSFFAKSVCVIEKKNDTKIEETMKLCLAAPYTLIVSVSEYLIENHHHVSVCDKWMKIDQLISIEVNHILIFVLSPLYPSSSSSSSSTG